MKAHQTISKPLKRPLSFLILCSITCFLLVHMYNRMTIVRGTTMYVESEAFPSDCTNQMSCRNNTQYMDIPQFGPTLTSHHTNSINETITRLEAALQDYLGQIERIKNDMLTNDLQWKQFPNSKERIIGYNEGYFEKLSKKDSLKTAFFKLDFEEMKKLLVQTYYEYTSNDCELVEKHSVYGQHLGKLMFNIECHADLNVLLKGHGLQENHLSVGLPQGFQHGSGPEKVWGHLNIVNNAVVSHNGDVYAPNLTLVPQRCKEMIIGSVPSNIERFPLHEEVFSVQQYWATGFYHSTLEGLPRLMPYLQYLRNNPQIKLNYQFKNPFLHLLDIPQAEARRVHQKFRGKIVYSPSGGPCGRSPLLNTQLLSLYVRRSLPNQPLERNKIILIRRSRKRFFNEHDAIHAMLKKEAASVNLEVFVFRDDPVPSLDITMRMFNDAIMVVAPHGAGESNLIFTQPGTVIIEGLCWDELHRGNLCYRNLAQVLGLRYHALFYKSQCRTITASQIQQPVKFFLQHLSEIRNSLYL